MHPHACQFSVAGCVGMQVFRDTECLCGCTCVCSLVEAVEEDAASTPLSVKVESSQSPKQPQHEAV